MSAVVTLPLAEIVADPELMPRAAYDEAHCAEIAGAYRSGSDVPPVIAFDDGQAKWLASGFQRHRAAGMAGLVTIGCILKRGSRRDAMLCASSQNATHPLKRNDLDKRKAVLMTLIAAPASWTDAQIAEHSGVSVLLVRAVRLTLAEHEAGVAPAGPADDLQAACLTEDLQAQIEQARASGGPAAAAKVLAEQEAQLLEQARDFEERAAAEWQARRVQRILASLRTVRRLWGQLELPASRLRPLERLAAWIEAELAAGSAAGPAGAPPGS